MSRHGRSRMDPGSTQQMSRKFWKSSEILFKNTFAYSESSPKSPDDSPWSPKPLQTYSKLTNRCHTQMSKQCPKYHKHIEILIIIYCHLWIIHGSSIGIYGLCMENLESSPCAFRGCLRWFCPLKRWHYFRKLKNLKNQDIMNAKKTRATKW